MRFASVKGISLLAFFVLLLWEVWKAFVNSELRTRSLRKISEAFEKSQFDEKILVNYYRHFHKLLYMKTRFFGVMFRIGGIINEMNKEPQINNRLIDLLKQTTNNSSTDPGHVQDCFGHVQDYYLTDSSLDVEHAAVQRLRKKVLKTECHQRKIKDIYPLNTDFNKGINPSAFRNILVSDKHQLLYCITPKVACTNWKRVLLVLDGYFTDPNNITASLAHDFNAGYFRRLSDYTPDEINLRLSTYYKFLFSRHPFERLTAAFRNKFVYKNNKNKFFSYIFGQFIVRKYRNNQNSTATSASTVRSGAGPVTFSEFAQYIIDSPLEDKEFWNEHWERIDRLCLPCLIQYDFLGKFETLKQDAEFLLRTIDAFDLVKFPDAYKGHDSTGSYMKKLFYSLPKEVLDKLYDLYKMDFLLFGYQNNFTS